ncbi:hypothetical protein Q4595_29360, partial [Wenyingzhuangia sp. 1_MG-2023]|nr:hypothetical protein [Wenyingzhuangia sp. 1_MG-2023]
RKLLPALYLLQRDGRLPEGKIISVSRRDITHDDYVEQVRKAVTTHVAKEYLEEAVWHDFASKLLCVSLDATDPSSYQVLN